MSIQQGTWLTPSRVTGVAVTLFALESLIFGLLALATHGFFGPMNPPGSSDFLSFYAAGKLANQGDAAAVYDQARHWAMERAVFGDPRVPYYYYFYPPVFTLLCAGLARLPYLAAFSLFIGVTLAAYLISLRLIAGRWRMALLCLTFPAVPFVIGLGQNSFLTAAIFGFGLILLDHRPGRAGAIFGLLIYKPHLALIVPIALAAARQTRALITMVISASLLIILSIAIFGLAPWHREFLEFQAMRHVFETGAIPFSGVVSVFAAARLMGGGIGVAYGLQGLGMIVAIGAVILIWRRPSSLGIRAASLIAAGIATAPVILFYDLLPITIALALIAQDARRTGYLAWERAACAILWAIPGLVIVSGEYLRLPLGPLATFLLLALALRRDHARTQMSDRD